MHSPVSAQQLVIMLVIVALLFGSRHVRRLRGDVRSLARELSDAAQRRMPVYSAETTRHQEAEFIRDRLPKRFPIAILIAALVLFAAGAWWLTR